MGTLAINNARDLVLEAVDHATRPSAHNISFPLDFHSGEGAREQHDQFKLWLATPVDGDPILVAVNAAGRP